MSLRGAPRLRTSEGRRGNDITKPMKISNKTKNLLLAVSVCAIIVIVLAYPNLCSGKDYDIKIVNPIKANDVTELIQDVTNYILAITASVMLILLIIAGYRYMTAGGNEERAKNAKNAIKWTIIGILIILVSGIVINSLIAALKR